MFSFGVPLAGESRQQTAAGESADDDYSEGSGSDYSEDSGSDFSEESESEDSGTEGEDDEESESGEDEDDEGYMKSSFFGEVKCKKPVGLCQMKGCGTVAGNMLVGGDDRMFVVDGSTVRECSYESVIEEMEQMDSFGDEFCVCDEEISMISLSSNGSYLAVLTKDETLHIYDTDSRSINEDVPGITHAEFCPNVDDENSILVYKHQEGDNPVHTLQLCHIGPFEMDTSDDVLSSAWSPDGSFIALLHGTDEKPLEICSVADGELNTITKLAVPGFKRVFWPGNNLICGVDGDGAIYAADIDFSKEVSAEDTEFLYVGNAELDDVEEQLFSVTLLDKCILLLSSQRTRTFFALSRKGWIQADVEDTANPYYGDKKLIGVSAAERGKNGVFFMYLDDGQLQRLTLTGSFPRMKSLRTKKHHKKDEKKDKNASKEVVPERCANPAAISANAPVVPSFGPTPGSTSVNPPIFSTPATSSMTPSVSTSTVYPSFFQSLTSVLNGWKTSNDIVGSNSTAPKAREEERKALQELQTAVAIATTGEVMSIRLHKPDAAKND